MRRKASKLSCTSASLNGRASNAMAKLLAMRDAIAELVPDGASVALGLQLEQMIPFAAGHEIIRQKKRDLTLIGPISDILFDQLIGSGCVEQVIAAWVGNVMMGSAYNFRRAAESEQLKIFNMTNFSVALALQAGAMGVPYLPTRTALEAMCPKTIIFSIRCFPRLRAKSRCWRCAPSIQTSPSSTCNAPTATATRTAGEISA